jgi:exo-1,4-beta-D-glucosaminidase
MAGQSLRALFNASDFSALSVRNPSLWWPWQMGEPTLHNLTLTFIVGNIVSDSITSRFGIRTVSSELDKNGHRLYRYARHASSADRASVNGRPILIRGGGWSPELFLRTTPERQRAEFEYIRHL